MASGRAWPPQPVAGCWLRAGQKAVGACPLELATSAHSFQSPRISMGGLVTLKTRADFLRVAATRRRAVTLGLILQAARQPEGLGRAPSVRVGFTASGKVGNAVTRNRAKRRLRGAAAAILSRAARPGTDYVL